MRLKSAQVGSPPRRQVALDLPLGYFAPYYPETWAAGSFRCYPVRAPPRGEAQAPSVSHGK
jgi:hypothetical protein